MPHSTESEFKLRSERIVEVAAVDAALRELGAACRASASHHHSDTYLDDAHGSLAAAGIGLRLRNGRNGRRMTCKGKDAAKGEGGLFVRTEIEAPWTRAKLPSMANELDVHLRDAIEPFTLDRPLVPVLRLEVDREVRMLTSHGADMCELAIDSVEAIANDRTARFQEVELEVYDDLDGSEQLAAALQDRLPMAFARDDKPTHAASLLGIERPRAAAPATDDAKEPTGDAVARSLLHHLAAMRAHEVGVRRDAGAEHLHDMRVAIRRMRNLVRAFRDLWPADDGARLLAELGEAGRRLGALRDLDVMLDSLRESVEQLPPQLRDAGRNAAAWVRERRGQQHHQLQEWLRSDERLAHAAAVEERIRRLPRETDAARQPIARAAAAAIGRAAAALRRHAREIDADLPIEPAHRLRLAAKRLRYLGEAFADLPRHRYRKALRAVTRVQQAFGLLCDHEVAAERLLGWVHSAASASSDGAWTAAALGALANVHRIGALAARARAVEVLARLDRKKHWRRFPSAPKR